MKIPILVPLVALPLLGLPASSGPAFPPWQLTATRDSFVINVNGQAMGQAVLMVERLPQGFRVTESTRIGTTVEQTTEILLDAEQRITSVLLTGKVRGQEARIELRYGDKRVKGTALVPGPDRPTSHNVDHAVPGDVVDDNLLQAVIGALPWSAGQVHMLQVFSGGKNALMTVSLTAVGSEEIALNGTMVEAHKVEMHGGEGVVDFYISKVAPHRLLKIAPRGTRFEMVRVN